jgi:hypothetical protein
VKRLDQVPIRQWLSANPEALNESSGSCCRVLPMRTSKTPTPQRVGTDTAGEFALLALELAALNPERLRDLMDELMGSVQMDARSEQANESG